MPTPASVHIFGPTIEAAPVLLDGGKTFSRSETGFDKLSLKMWGFTANPTSYANTQFPAGGSALALGYANMFCSSVGINQVGNQTYTFDVEYVGLIGSQAVKRTISSKSQSYTTGSINIPGTGVVPQAQGQYINLSCQFNYVTATMPSTTATPTAPAGSSLPSPPSPPFTTITTPIYNYPSGWIREGLDVDMVNGTDLVTSIFLVKESWVYVYPVMPG
jgi:hypothetical protein